MTQTLLKAGLMASAVALVPLAAQADDEIELGTPFIISEFDEDTDRYEERPTFVTLHENGKWQDWLEIDVDFEKVTDYDLINKGNAFLGVSKDSALQSIAAIDTYLEWESMAKQDDDIVWKNIARIEEDAKYADLRYEFFSASTNSHYLVVSGCSLGICDDRTRMFFDRENAIRYKDFLTKWVSGAEMGLTEEEVDLKYN